MSDVVTLETSGRVGLIVINNPPVNAIGQLVRQGLQDQFAAAARNTAIEAIVLMCDGRTFIAGADLAEFDAPMGPPTCHDLFSEIEASQKPVVAALHGTALGGGAETALACHYRVAERGARIGFPEINLGIVPGAGGTQRLPRLVGVQAALKMFLSGRPVSADQALESGLLDAVTDGKLREFAISFAEDLIDDGRGPRRTCAIDIERNKNLDEFLAGERNRIAAQMPGREVPAMDIDAVEAAIDLSFHEGIKREEEISDASLGTLESRAMRRLFFAERGTARLPGAKSDVFRDIGSGGIVGAGTMGRGIAMAFANAGLPVTLLDVDQGAVDGALATIRGEYENRVKRGRMTLEDVDTRVKLISGSTEYSSLSDSDVVIEAVFEDMSLKKKIFESLDQCCKPGAILASNTSTLDVAEIASATKRPADVVGLHFFSPAHIMRLLEVIRTDETADDVLVTSMRLAKQLHKVGVVSGNAYGFIGNRMMEPYGREAERLVLEGATPRQVDDVLQRFGMAMGILAVYDMAGVDVGYKVRQERRAYLPDDPSFCRASDLLAENNCLGQKTGTGFYRYEKGSRERHDNPEAMQMFADEAARLGIEQREITDKEIEQRCIIALINEGAKVLEEGVALRAADIDVVYTSGYGFPRHRGGPMFYADSVGLGVLCEQIDSFAQQFDPQYWQASALLRRLWKEGASLSDYTNI